jgi:uncharacterized cupredoxin-like copper-binding protein
MLIPKISLVLLAGMTLSLAIFGAACSEDDGGGDSAEAGDVEAAVQGAAAAWNGEDIEGFLALFTDNALAVMFDSTREELTTGLAEYPIGEPAWTVDDFSDTEVDGDHATTKATFYMGRAGSPEIFSLVQQDDAWLIDNREPTTGDTGDATAADLSTSEYAFIPETQDVTDGNVAFNVSNVGGEEHEVFIAKVPEDLDIEQALQSEEQPEGVEDIGSIVGLLPGTEATLLFQDDLTPGRYALLCFVSNAEGTPHAFLGMIGEFTVVEGSTTDGDTPAGEATPQ